MNRTQRILPTAIGSAYERIVQQKLGSYGTLLSASGGARDQCVDLFGTWSLPWKTASNSVSGDAVSLICTSSNSNNTGSSQMWNVIVQCKATKKPAGTSDMRGFQLSLDSHPLNTIGIFACTSGFAMREIARERYFIRRHTLLLHISMEGALLSAFALTAVPTTQVKLPPMPSFHVQPLLA